MDGRRVHLTDHLSQGYHIPGIFVLRPKATIGAVLEDLFLIAQVDISHDYQDRITHIPL